MLNNLKKRILTSLILFFLLSIMIIDKFFLTYFLIIIGAFSLLEFFKMISIIFKKNKLKKLLYNLIFIIYIFVLSTYFVIFSSFFHLKLTILIILFTCIASDIGGFVFGKIFKGMKLTKISPNKTVSGSIGSFLFSILFITFIFFQFTDTLDLLVPIIGFLTSLGAQIGDLFFSSLKRKSSLKDTGNYLPGHGGILDRIDGILLGLPVGFLAIVLIY
jgi:phosphatidate cytidylyltransferase